MIHLHQCFSVLTRRQTLRLYDVASNSMKSSFQHRAAVLSAAFDSEGKNAYSGGLDSWIRKYVTRIYYPNLSSDTHSRFDLETEKSVVLGAHEETISNVVYSSELSMPSEAICGERRR